MKHFDIDHKIRIHDTYNLEQKISFFFNNSSRSDEYKVENYFFIPKNLGVNKKTYNKELFYTRLQNYIRFKTPVYPIEKICSDNPESPYMQVIKVIEQMEMDPSSTELSDKFEKEIKRFGAIVKSALRDHVFFIENKCSDPNMFSSLTEKYLDHSNIIINKLNNMWKKIYSPAIPENIHRYFLYTEEACIIFINEYSDKLVKINRKMFKRSNPDFYKEIENKLLGLITGVIGLREKKHDQLPPNDKKRAEKFLFRKRILKKYISSFLFLNININDEKKKMEHFLFALAAGFAMFASIAGAYYFQKNYDNFSFPVITALVIMYMAKDRIKAIGQNFFSKILNKYYYDHKIDITSKDFHSKIGLCYQHFKYINESDIPDNILSLRNKDQFENLNREIIGEDTFVYKKKLKIYPLNIHSVANDINGLNEITRINIREFLDKMDNPASQLLLVKEDGYDWEEINRFYYIHICTRLISNKEETVKYFRVKLNRRGLKKITEL